ncbi:hypothetical protein DCW30_28085 [Streptomyces alfalfae]|uniref:Uncharacterized protein n=2 Tax=Streptomyces alfalfae TaxID=1642299 RepID=A0A4Q2G9X9_9ACTN|nr:hypothetical protein [Streptomyces alfalfae]AYA16365.1 hypothetical protein D3X13_09165 [Streptomyces fradiae]QQC91764.1 hypothetical protein I8755_27695 [Streptomyces alfalfae]QUI34280.1 hypothetical protein H9W91_28070 [Streptomyces alfalfae]RXX38352.1 hypothetical protein DCW30_28085 [Streptomyces alfalfae]RZN01057.1 hypothetical protein D4104_08710 [Streptomyces alfalfae]
MPLLPEEPQIHESAQGPRATPASGRTAPTPRPVPGPRPVAPPRPGRPGPARPMPPAQRTPHAAAPKPGPAAPAVPAPAASRPAPADGAAAPVPQIQLIPASAEGALDAAEEAVDLLLDTGRAPGDVLVVTTGDPHPWATHELSFGEAAYWAQHDAGDDVFYADAAALGRAAARPVVVVAVNGGEESALAALPEAVTRAGALLIVCGDPQRINSVLGAGV